MSRCLALSVLLLLVGCVSSGGGRDAGTPSLTLEAKWLPLTRVVQGNLPLVPDQATTTLGSTVYVTDLQAWMQEHPVGDPRFTALMLHEREHARRQAKDSTWFPSYLASPSFAWAEEQVGWRLELLWLRDHGVNWLPRAEDAARDLAGYRVIGGQMVSYEEAFAWVQAILNGPSLRSEEE